MARIGWGWLAIASCVWIGCGDDPGSNEDHETEGTGGGGGAGTTSGTGAGSGTGGSGGALPGDWQTLISGDWSLAPGSESYTCVVATVPEQMYIHAIRPTVSPGTHHTVLTRAGASQPDGTFDCDAGTNGQNMLFGSGVGTEPFALPPGVAVKVEAGEKLLLNLHLFNVQPNSLSGTSAIEVQLLEPSEVVHEAQAVLAGTQNILINPMSAGSASGSCTIPAAKSLFAVFPHMHQLGVHMKVSVNGQTLLDAPYSFDDQRWSGLQPIIDLQAGDQVLVTCDYQNTTNQPVTFGDSSNAEMCFAGLFFYPEGGLGFICDD